jgi:hypothetical protein
MRNHPLYHDLIEDTIRVFRWSKKWANTAKEYVAPDGWKAVAYLTNRSPLTDRLLPMPQWWITEIKRNH